MIPDDVRAQLAQRATVLRSLHRRGEPLVIPNAWDAASARAFADAGFPAIATTSGGIADVLGHPDADVMPADEAFAAVARIARYVDRPVSADLEAGYRLDADELVGRLLAAGAVGLNIEDSDHHGPGVLVDADRQADRLAGIKEAGRRAGVDVVLNARIDVFVRGAGGAPEALARAQAYRAAGADCVYPIVATDEGVIGALAAVAPVNVLALPAAPAVGRLAELGVARVSFGSRLMRHAYASAVALAQGA